MLEWHVNCAINIIADRFISTDDAFQQQLVHSYNTTPCAKV